MSEDLKPYAENYSAGDIGANARVAIGKDISWVEGVVGLPDGQTLKQQFTELMEKIDEDTALDEDTRELAKAKAHAVAQGLANVQETPGILRRALIDAKSWFSGTASWVGQALGDVLTSEAAQKTIGTVTEAGTKAAMTSFLE